MKENSREEDIVKKFEELCGNWYVFKDDDRGGHFEKVVGDQKANTLLSYLIFKEELEDFLSDYKRVLKENDKLKKSNQCYINSIQAITPVLTQDYVSKQEIKDKIKKLNKKEKEELKRMKGQDRYFVKQIYQNKRIILKELIEEREKKWKK